MKKALLIFLCLVLLLSVIGCSSNRRYNEMSYLVQVLDPMEYSLYQNIFFNDQSKDYVEKTLTKEGTYARLYDGFSNKYRYYVWGYSELKCYDWQWEFVPEDPDSLPPIGSLVKITGTLTRDEAALDKLWLTNVSLSTEKTVEAFNCEIDMTVMSNTLERVQLLNMQRKPEAFAGKTLRIYGRILNPTTIQHACFDNIWTQDFSTDAEVPAIGTIVILTGTWQGDTIQAGKVEITKDY